MSNEESSEDVEFEWRVEWSASSNISFHGGTGWTTYDGFAESEGEIRADLEQGNYPEALNAALEESGFGYELHVRPIGSVS